MQRSENVCRNLKSSSRKEPLFGVDEEEEKEEGRQSLLSRTPPAALCTGGVSTLRSHTVREVRPADVASTEDRDKNLGRIPLSPLLCYLRTTAKAETDAIIAICSMLLEFMHQLGQRNRNPCLLCIQYEWEFNLQDFHRNLMKMNGAKLRNQFSKIGSNPINREEFPLLRQVKLVVPPSLLGSITY